MPRALLIFAALLLGGCVTSTPERDAGTEPIAPERVTLLERDDGPFDPTNVEGDAMCALGGLEERPRDHDARILPGASKVVFTVELEGTTGFQFGYRVDPEESILWLPVTRDDAAWEVPVGPDQTEQDALKWHFFYRLNTDPPQDCYTGVSGGGITYRIEAVR